MHFTIPENPEPRLAGGTQLPRYKCHKEVWALKIAKIEFDEEPLRGAWITPADLGYGSFRVDAAYVRKHNPIVGGYYVVYRDGYESWSPASEFEDGYTRL